MGASQSTLRTESIGLGTPVYIGLVEQTIFAPLFAAAHAWRSRSTNKLRPAHIRTLNKLIAKE